MLAWTIPGKWYGRRLGRAILITAVMVIVGGLVFTTQKQVTYWQSSRTLFEQALKVTQPNFVAHNNLGNALLEDGEIEAAIAHFRTAVSMDPKDPAVFNNLGNALMKLESIDEAIVNYSRSIALNPAKAKAYNNLAVALHKQTQLTASIQHLRTALRLKPDYAEAYNNLGAVYRETGQIKNAARCYLTAIRLKPDFPQPYNNLGLLLWQEKKLADAIHYFRQALTVEPGFEAAADNLNQAQALLNAFEETASSLEIELHRHPNNVDLIVELGDLYKAHNRLGAAVKYYQRALVVQPDSIPIKRRLAFAHAKQGRYQTAIALLKGLIHQHPDNTDLYYNIAGIYSRSNRLEDSIYWLKMAISKGFSNYEQIKVDRNFDNLKGTSFFKSLFQEG